MARRLEEKPPQRPIAPVGARLAPSAQSAPQSQAPCRQTGTERAWYCNDRHLPAGELVPGGSAAALAGRRLASRKTESFVHQIAQRPARQVALQVVAKELGHVVNPPGALTGHVGRDQHIG